MIQNLTFKNQVGRLTYLSASPFFFHVFSCRHAQRHCRIPKCHTGEHFHSNLQSKLIFVYLFLFQEVLCLHKAYSACILLQVREIMWKCFYAEYFHLIPKYAMPNLCFQLTPMNGLDPLWIWINVASLISFYLSNSWQLRIWLKTLIGSKKWGKMKYQNKSNKHRYIQSIFSIQYLILFHQQASAPPSLMSFWCCISVN